MSNNLRLSLTLSFLLLFIVAVTGVTQVVNDSSLAIQPATLVAQLASNLHPADGDSTNSITQTESNNYSYCWKTSCAWPSGPTPPNQEYANAAAFIWKSGETYHYESAQTCPQCYATGVAQTTNPGAYVWAKEVKALSTSSFSYGQGVAVDNSGNVISGGYIQGSVDTGCGTLTSAGSADIYLVKHSADGSCVWVKQYGGLNDDAITGVVVDSSGGIYVTGYFNGTVDFGSGPIKTASVGIPDIFLLKLTSSGTISWVKNLGGTGDDKGFVLALDSRDNVIISGYFGAYGSAVDFGNGPLSSAGGRDIYVAKYTSAGAPLWSKRFGGTGDDWTTGVSVDKRDDSIVLTGNFANTVNFGGGDVTFAGGRDIFLTKLNSSGDYVFARKIGSAEYEQAGGVAVDRNGNISVGGTFYGSINFGTSQQTVTAGTGDAFIAVYNPDGSEKWVKHWGSTLGGDAFLALATDSQNNILATGFINSNVDFGGGRLWYNGTVTSPDILVTKFSENGTYVFAKRYGTGFPDAGRGVTTDSSNNVYVSGFYATSANFGGVTFTTGNRDSAFVLKLKP